MKSKKVLFCAALAALMVTACSDDQTSFNIDKVPGDAVIKGKVAYNTGATLVNNKFEYDYEPCANLPLYFKVRNSNYSGSLDGYSIFTAITDAEGNYQITIPASANAMSVDITSEAFEGVENYIKVVNGKPQQAQRNVVYRVNQKSVSVDDHAIKFTNLLCANVSTEQEFVNYNEHATITGTIGKNSEYYIAPEKVYKEVTTWDKVTQQYITENVFDKWADARIEKVFVPAASVDLVVSVKYNDPNITSAVEFNVTTNSNGEYTLQVPVQDFPASFSYTIEGFSYSSTFTHYVEDEKEYTMPSEDEDADPIVKHYMDYKPVSINGWYEPVNTFNYNATFPVSSTVVNNMTKLLLFNASPEALDGLVPFYNSSTFKNVQWLSELLKKLEEEKEEKINN